MRRKHPPTCRSGMVLIVVLLVLSVIAALVLEFHHDSRLKFQLVANTRAAHQALHCAEGGLAIAMAALEQNRNIWAEGGLAEIFSGAQQVPVGQGYCTISVAAESGRINVNELIDSKGQPVQPQIERMLRLIDLLNARNRDGDRLSYGLVPAIIDWIDPDDEVTVLPFIQGRNAGAESDYYQGLEKPYKCKNAPLEVLGELMLVKGITKDILHGPLDPEKTGPPVGLEQFLTVHGRGRLNINDASIIMLETLSEQIDRTTAERIVRHRPYTNMNELAEVPGMTPAVLRAIRDHTAIRAGDEYYTVTTCGTVGQSSRVLRVLVRRNRTGSRIVPVIRWER